MIILTSSTGQIVGRIVISPAILAHDVTVTGSHSNRTVIGMCRLLDPTYLATLILPSGVSVDMNRGTGSNDAISLDTESVCASSLCAVLASIGDVYVSNDDHCPPTLVNEV